MSNNNSTVKVVIFSILFGIILLIGAILLFSKKEDDVSLPIKFEEFSDYQCSACKLYYPEVNKIIEEFGLDIDFQYRHFHIDEGSYEASLAAESARLQGKFKEYSDLLFNNSSLHTDNYVTFASSLGLDIEKFKNDMQGEIVKAKVDADVAEGNKRLINATPTFFINGKKVVFKETDNPIEVLRTTLKEKIEKAKQNISGTDNSQ